MTYDAFVALKDVTYVYQSMIEDWGINLMASNDLGSMVSALKVLSEPMLLMTSSPDNKICTFLNRFNLSRNNSMRIAYSGNTWSNRIKMQWTLWKNF